MSAKQLTLVLFLFFIACKSATVIEDFDSFYDRFHMDEQFQVSRILFPLEGGSAQVDGTIPWTKNNWITMKTKIQDVDKNQFKVEVKKTEDTFMQKFQMPGSGFGAEYRFRKINGKWFLVYALDSNL